MNTATLNLTTLTTETTWIDAHVLNLYEGGMISLRHEGPYGRTSIEVVGSGVPALMGDSLALLQQADKDARAEAESMSADTDVYTQKVDTYADIYVAKATAITREWSSRHIVQYEQDAHKDPTGRIRINGNQFPNIRARYSSDEE